MRCQPKAVLACNDRQRHRARIPTDVQNMAFCPTKGHLLRCKRTPFARQNVAFRQHADSQEDRSGKQPPPNLPKERGINGKAAPPDLPKGRGVDEKAAPPDLPKGRRMNGKAAPPNLPKGRRMNGKAAPPDLPKGRRMNGKAAPPDLPKGRRMVKRLMS